MLYLSVSLARAQSKRPIHFVQKTRHYHNQYRGVALAFETLKRRAFEAYARIRRAGKASLETKTGRVRLFYTISPGRFGSLKAS